MNESENTSLYDDGNLLLGVWMFQEPNESVGQWKAYRTQLNETEQWTELELVDCFSISEEISEELIDTLLNKNDIPP